MFAWACFRDNRLPFQTHLELNRTIGAEAVFQVVGGQLSEDRANVHQNTAVVGNRGNSERNAP